MNQMMTRLTMTVMVHFEYALDTGYLGLGIPFVFTVWNVNIPFPLRHGGSLFITAV
jgi:hypothetical protein